MFDRSHYEDVLVARVHGLVPEQKVQARYAKINAFEAKPAEQGVTILECFLHVGFDAQRERLLARLADPDKQWKFNAADVDERARWSDYWSDYVAAYETAGALQHAGRTVVRRAVRPQAYRHWAVAELVRETMTAMDPHYPHPDVDVNRMRQRLAPPN